MAEIPDAIDNAVRGALGKYRLDTPERRADFQSDRQGGFFNRLFNRPSSADAALYYRDNPRMTLRQSADNPAFGGYAEGARQGYVKSAAWLRDQIAEKNKTLGGTGVSFVQRAGLERDSSGNILTPMTPGKTYPTPVTPVAAASKGAAAPPPVAPTPAQQAQTSAGTAPPAPGVANAATPAPGTAAATGPAADVLAPVAAPVLPTYNAPKPLETAPLDLSKTIGEAEKRVSDIEGQKNAGIELLEMSPDQRAKVEQAKIDKNAGIMGNVNADKTYTVKDSNGNSVEVADKTAWSNSMTGLIGAAEKSKDMREGDRWLLGEMANPQQYFDSKTGKFDRERMLADHSKQQATTMRAQWASPDGRRELLDQMADEFFKSKVGRMLAADAGNAAEKFRSKYGGYNHGAQQAQESANQAMWAAFNGYVDEVYNRTVTQYDAREKERVDLAMEKQKAWSSKDEAAKQRNADREKDWLKRRDDAVKDLISLRTTGDVESYKAAEAAKRENFAADSRRAAEEFAANTKLTLGLHGEDRQDARSNREAALKKKEIESHERIGMGQVKAAQTAAENKGAGGSGHTTEQERAAKSRTDFVAEYIKNKQASGLPLNRDQLMAAEREATEMWDRLNGAKATVGGAERKTTPKGEIIEKQADGGWLVVGMAGGK